MMDAYTKKCPRCCTVKLVEDFDKNSGRGDGRDSYCKECRKAIRKSTQSRNAPSRRKRWGDRMFDFLRIDDSEY